MSLLFIVVMEELYRLVFTVKTLLNACRMFLSHRQTIIIRRPGSRRYFRVLIATTLKELNEFDRIISNIGKL